MTRWLSAIALCWGALLFAGSASASMIFPPEIETHLNLSYAPQCALCHDGTPGLGTATTPFAEAMKARGLMPEDLSSLDTALDRMKADGVDSDGDKVSDIQELINGTDPNKVGGASAPQPELAYGCASLAPGHPNRSAAAFAIGAVAIAMAWARRRRRRVALIVSAAGAALLLIGCYDVSYVSTTVCETGLEWTGGDDGSEDMHPGVACIDCHTKNDGPSFKLAGTVFGANDPDNCGGVNGASIVITGADKKMIQMDANEIGNFNTTLSVAFPYNAMIVVNGKSKPMLTPQSTGDCNSCHTQTGLNGAPGRITPP